MRGRIDSLGRISTGTPRNAYWHIEINSDCFVFAPKRCRDTGDGGRDRPGVPSPSLPPSRLGGRWHSHPGITPLPRRRGAYPEDDRKGSECRLVVRSIDSLFTPTRPEHSGGPILPASRFDVSSRCGTASADPTLFLSNSQLPRPCCSHLEWGKQDPCVLEEMSRPRMLSRYRKAAESGDRGGQPPPPAAFPNGRPSRGLGRQEDSCPARHLHKHHEFMNFVLRPHRPKGHHQYTSSIVRRRDTARAE